MKWTDVDHWVRGFWSLPAEARIEPRERWLAVGALMVTSIFVGALAWSILVLAFLV